MLHCVNLKPRRGTTDLARTLEAPIPPPHPPRSQERCGLTGLLTVLESSRLTFTYTFALAGVFLSS